MESEKIEAVRPASPSTDCAPENIRLPEDVEDSTLGTNEEAVVRPASPPRIFPSEGFDLVGSGEDLEEENWPFYSPETFYPVRIGEIFQSRYQVIGKLGYGAHSTAWLCRDLR